VSRPVGGVLGRLQGPGLRLGTVSGVLTTRPRLIEWADAGGGAGRDSCSSRLIWSRRARACSPGRGAAEMARLTLSSRPLPSARRPARTACSSEPPWAPTPGQRSQVAGWAARTRSNASASVAPTTRPTCRPQDTASRATSR